MGEVYLAMSHGPAGFRKLVVLKCMHAASAEEENVRTMFLDEAMLAARLSHHNVVQTYEAGEHDGQPYIAMEYLEGQPLSRLTKAVPAMHPRMAAHIISEVLAGLHYAHQLKDFDGTPLAIVHRDLSPPNIFVTYDGVVKVVDFGIAKTSLASRAKTEAGVFKGKIAYMAPEQALHEEIDHRADIFSAGAVLWELIAGKRLFRELSPALTLKRLLHDPIPSLASEKPGLDPALDAIVQRALAREPDQRYGSALEMRQDLQRFLRSGEHANWDAELATLISEKFAKQRQKVQQQVQQCMSQDAESPEGLPSVNLNDTGKSGTQFAPVSLDMATISAPIVMDSSSGASPTSSGVISGFGPANSNGLPSLTPSGVAFGTAFNVSSGPPGGVGSMGPVGSTSSFGAGMQGLGEPYASEAPRSLLQRVGIGMMLGALLLGAATAFAVMVFTSSDEAGQEPVTAQAASMASSTLEVVSTPPGAMIFVNGEPSGLVTPATLKGLTAGKLTLRLDKAGYQAKEAVIQVEAGPMAKRSFELVESEGMVRFAGAPSGARLYIDDVAVAESMDGEIAVPVGSHRIRVETNAGPLFSRTVDVTPGKQTIQIEKARGTQ